MADVLKRLAGPAAGTGAEATLYTVPASTTTVIRHIRVANTTTTAQTFKLTIGADAAGTRLNGDTSIAGNGGVYDWTGMLVLAAAETLRWNGPSTLTITVSGIEAS